MTTFCKNQKNKSFPKSFGKSCITTPHSREWAHPLHVLLSVQCSLQICPITQSRVCYSHTAVPHSYYTLHCAVQFSPPQKVCPFPLGISTSLEKNHPSANPTHHPRRHNWHTYTEVLMLLVMYDKLAKLAISQCGHQCTHNMQPA